MPYRLVTQHGPLAGQAYPLAQAINTVGRDARNEIVVNDPEVSRSHARLVVQPDGLLVEDLASTNGTFINGQRLATPRLLRPGDRLGLGETIVLLLERLAETGQSVPVQPAGGAQHPITTAPLTPPVPPVLPAPPAPPKNNALRWLAIGCGCLALFACAALSCAGVWWLWENGDNLVKLFGG